MLPGPLRNLVGINAVEITHRRFNDAVAELISTIENTIKAGSEKKAAASTDPRVRIAG
jgi:hypothetical protein